MDKKTIKAKWLEELRSGNHIQVPGTLKGITADGEVGYCCLGVLQEKVMGEKLKAEALTYDPDVDDLPHYTFEGPQRIYTTIKEETIGDEFLVNQLTDRNDSGHTFAEIADYIGQEWKV